MATKGFLEVQWNVDGIEEPGSRFSSRYPPSMLQAYELLCPDLVSNPLASFPFSLSLEIWREAAFSLSSEVTGEEGFLVLGRFVFAEPNPVLGRGSLPIFPLVLELLGGLRPASLHLGEAVGTPP